MYKVGDKVRGKASGRVGTILRCLSFDCYDIQLDDNNTIIRADISSFELDTPQSTLVPPIEPPKYNFQNEAYSEYADKYLLD